MRTDQSPGATSFALVVDIELCRFALLSMEAVLQRHLMGPRRPSKPTETQAHEDSSVSSFEASCGKEKAMTKKKRPVMICSCFHFSLDPRTHMLTGQLYETRTSMVCHAFRGCGSNVGIKSGRYRVPPRNCSHLCLQLSVVPNNPSCAVLYCIVATFATVSISIIYMSSVRQS